MLKKSPAEGVISKYWTDNTIPIDPIRIASKMGVSVMAKANLETSGHYDPPQAQTDDPLITYNPLESPVRQRFTIAHELGHHVLNHGVGDRVAPANFTMTSSDPKEVAANQFAAELLMPGNFVRAVVEVQKIRSLKELAKIFNVSTAAMGYRLRELGYAIS